MNTNIIKNENKIKLKGMETINVIQTNYFSEKIRTFPVLK
jgi:hypothetical protein